MPRKVSRFAAQEQPINWWRAFIAGAGGATMMMAFIDIFYLLGLTQFSFELYLGSLFRHTQYGPHGWTVGVLANWVLGGIFGWLYAYFFEYNFRRADARLGTFLGFGHAIVAAVALFPFFGVVHEFLGTGLFPHFGFFGSRLEPQTPILLLFAHLIFGATTGLFYGPARVERVRAREFEPGESGLPGEPEVITPAEDPEDRMAI